MRSHEKAGIRRTRRDEVHGPVLLEEEGKEARKRAGCGDRADPLLFRQVRGESPDSLLERHAATPRPVETSRARRTAAAAAVTPAKREAWPSVRGRCLSSFSIASFDRPGMPLYTKPAGKTRSEERRTPATASSSRVTKPSYRG